MSSRAITARRRLRIIQAASLVAVILGGAAVAKLAVGAFRPHLYSGTVFKESVAAPPMDGLIFTDGSPADPTGFEGKVILVYFGYTKCPDVCPTTLSTAAQAIEDLGDQGDNVELWMVTVDPDRDDPETLAGYMTFFHPRFLGVTGSADDIDRAASAYGVFYQLGEGTPETGYTVDHTATLMGIGPDGALRITWPTGVTSEALAADIDELLS
jgi:protein SCO1/2